MSVYPSPLTELEPRGYIDKGPHDGTQPGSGGALFAGAPPKLCNYDNSTYPAFYIPWYLPSYLLSYCPFSLTFPPYLLVLTSRLTCSSYPFVLPSQNTLSPCFPALPSHLTFSPYLLTLPSDQAFSPYLLTLPVCVLTLFVGRT